jgi:hypothetical protein
VVFSQEKLKEMLPVGGVCDQKTTKFFGDESMAGHMGVNGAY